MLYLKIYWYEIQIYVRITNKNAKYNKVWPKLKFQNPQTAVM